MKTHKTPAVTEKTAQIELATMLINRHVFVQGVHIMPYNTDVVKFYTPAIPVHPGNKEPLNPYKTISKKRIDFIYSLFGGVKPTLSKITDNQTGKTTYQYNITFAPDQTEYITKYVKEALQVYINKQADIAIAFCEKIRQDIENK